MKKGTVCRVLKGVAVGVLVVYVKSMYDNIKAEFDSEHFSEDVEDALNTLESIEDCEDAILAVEIREELEDSIIDEVERLMDLADSFDGIGWTLSELAGHTSEIKTRKFIRDQYAALGEIPQGIRWKEYGGSISGGLYEYMKCDNKLVNKAWASATKLYKKAAKLMELWTGADIEEFIDEETGLPTESLRCPEYFTMDNADDEDDEGTTMDDIEEEEDTKAPSEVHHIPVNGIEDKEAGTKTESVTPEAHEELHKEAETGRTASVRVIKLGEDGKEISRADVNIRVDSEEVKAPHGDSEGACGLGVSQSCPDPCPGVENCPLVTRHGHKKAEGEAQEPEGELESEPEDTKDSFEKAPEDGEHIETGAAGIKEPVTPAPEGFEAPPSDGEHIVSGNSAEESEGSAEETEGSTEESKEDKSIDELVHEAKQKVEHAFAELLKLAHDDQ